ncbi:MAG: pilus assembly protein [Acholeplasmataceae bacterium]|nr:pilus assembly protein [Acholeplasmataceae bacterium]
MFNNIKKNKGQSLVEMAIILPVLIALIFGMTDFARVLNGYLVATEASREGARVAAMRGDDAEVVLAVNAAASSLNPAKMTITTTPATRVRGDSVTVTVTYNMDIVTPLINTMLTNPLPITCQTIMRVE